MVIVLWAIMGLVVAYLASKKGHSFVGWFVYGVLLWPIALIHIALASNKAKKCPKCFSNIDARATICPHCQHKITAEEIKVTNEVRQKGQKKRNIVLAVIGAVILLPFVIAGFISNSALSKLPKVESNSPTTAPTQQSTFVASVHFTGSEFVISNLDPHTCQNAKMQVNSDYSLEGYTLESGLTSVTKSGEVTVYKVGPGQFAKKDGTRFNVFTTKPQSFYIGCRGNNELTNAYWYGSF